MYACTSYYNFKSEMLKRILYIILFLGLSGLLYAHEPQTVSLSFPAKKSVRNTPGLPPTADDVITVDFRTNYCFVRVLVDEEDFYTDYNPQAHTFLNENVLKGLFVQKTYNFFSNRYIYLLNCIWQI